MTAFRQLPFMGVIRVNNEAMKVGYRMGDPVWSNLGQGQPEVGELAAPPRFSDLHIDIADHAYGPVEGIPEYRQAVADHYNRLFRRGKASQYTAENVAVAPGGRAALTRICAALDKVRLGYFTPDYTAYEDLLTTFPRIQPSWIELKPETGFAIDPAELDARVARDKLTGLLISNPCNPTGVVIHGAELAAWVAMARKRACTLLLDEFYSHYIYDSGKPGAGAVSAAAYVEDVNADPVVIVDGLTKCFRYPGWRSGWVVAPKSVIQALTAAGSFLDGGPSRPIQRAAIEVLKPARADQETNAVRVAFAEKQRLTVSILSDLGVKFPVMQHAAKIPLRAGSEIPLRACGGGGESAAGGGAGGGITGTFYAWGDVSSLPAPLSDGVGFMREAFKHQVLTVPGEFFDVNPGRERTGKSPLSGYVRFSFGPPRANLEAGLNRLAEMVRGKKR